MAFVLVLVTAFSAVACSDAGAELTYSKDMEDVLTRLTTSCTDFSADTTVMFKDLTEDNRKTVLEDLDEMKAIFGEISELKAPKKYEGVQALLKESADNAFQAIEIYKKELGEVTTETLDESFLKRLEEGDAFLTKAQEKMLAAGEQLEKIGS